MTLLGKHIAKYLTIVAGLFFLAHIVIPHHHHGNRICFNNDHCKYHTIDHDHNHQEPDHQHDSDNHTHQCCDNEFVPVSLNDTYRLSNNRTTVDKYFTGFTCFLHPDSIRLSIPLPTTIVVNYAIIPLYSVIIQASSGLRAPPVV